jgi:hypothetical protein
VSAKGGENVELNEYDERVRVALPKLAAWLVDHPMADDDLAILVDDVQRGKAPYPPGMRALETLVNALTLDAPETEGATNGR